MSSREIMMEKWNGAGNDFIVIDTATEPFDRESFAIRECDRIHGIGADGVLFLSLDSKQNPIHVEMTLVQPDGSTASMCGNGARIAAQWGAEKTGVKEVVVVTPAGNRVSTINASDVTVDMGAFSFDPDDVNLNRDTPLIDEPMNGLTVTGVDTGVPHAVAFVPDVDAVDLETIATPIRNDPVFREGANVTIASPDASGYHQRTFERGIEGETVACGTGAVAITAVAFQRGEVTTEHPVTILPPGGVLEVTIHEDRTATLAGPVRKEFTKTIEVPDV